MAFLTQPCSYIPCMSAKRHRPSAILNVAILDDGLVAYMHCGPFPAFGTLPGDCAKYDIYVGAAQRARPVCTFAWLLDWDLPVWLYNCKRGIVQQENEYQPH